MSTNWHGFQNSIHAQLHNYIIQDTGKVILNHVHSNIRDTEEEEAMPRKYKRLKLGGSQAYDQSTDQLQFLNG
jgi:hypothetical protein